jgi:hypothetical protein
MQNYLPFNFYSAFVNLKKSVCVFISDSGFQIPYLIRNLEFGILNSMQVLRELRRVRQHLRASAKLRLSKSLKAK